ncbi:MAG: Inner membrane transport permease YadH [Myxococcota bacterium]|nr:Inner membrane transport permease YadH [Myxococcota bacterium]
MQNLRGYIPGYGAWLVTARNLRMWRRYWVSSLAGLLGEPILFLLSLGFGVGSLISSVQGRSYPEFIAPGLAISAAMYAAAFEAVYGGYTRMVPQKTYDAILATPLGIADVVGGEVLYCGIKGLQASAAVTLVVASAGLLPDVWRAAVFLPLLGLLTGLVFGALSMLVVAFARSYDFFNYYISLGLAPMFLFSGIFYPLDTLPPAARAASEWMPLGQLVALSRAAAFGTPPPHGWGVPFLLALGLAAYLPAVDRIRSRLLK